MYAPDGRFYTAVVSRASNGSFRLEYLCSEVGWLGGSNLFAILRP